MGWSRFDDLYDDHPKVMAATHTCPLAATLHAQAITASSRRESDGLVDPFWLLARAPEKRKRTEALSVLVSLRLYDLLPAGEARALTDAAGFTVTLGPFTEDRHLVHDYLDYNPSSAQLQDRRRAEAERKARGRRAESADCPPGVRPDISRTPDGPRGGAGADPQPIPSHPIPKEADASSSAVAAVEQNDRDDILALCDLLATLVATNDPRAKVAPDSKGWRDAARLLLDRDERPLAEAVAVIRWSQADPFWRANVLSMPKLREKYPQLLLKMNATPASKQSGPSANDFLRIARGEAA